MSDPTAEKPDTAKLEAFFAAIPDPPQNTLVALADGHADAEETDAEDEPAPKGEAVSKPAATKNAKAAAASDAPAKSVGEDAPLADRVLAALKAGDLDTLADLTDQDPSNFDEKSTKWAAKNRKEAKLKAEAEKVKADAQAIVDHYEPIDTRVERFQTTRDYRVVKELVELLTGEDFDSVAMKTFRAVRGEDPRVPVLAKRLEATEAELAGERTAKEKASDRALREALRDDLPSDHQVRKLPDWEDQVAAVLRESFDEDLGEPSLSFKQAAQRVVRRAKDAYQKYASVFAEPSAAPPRRASAPERAAGAAPAGKRKLTQEEFYSQFK
jgi:hypothetical protein